MKRLASQLLTPLGLATFIAMPTVAAEPPRGCLFVEPRTGFDGTGYLHYADVRNECTAPVRCSLWTDVDPSPQSVRVEVGQRAEVVFRRGSPASEFRAFARCQFR